MATKKQSAKTATNNFLQDQASFAPQPKSNRTGGGMWALVVVLSLVVGAIASIATQQPFVRQLFPVLFLANQNNQTGTPATTLVVEKREQVQVAQEEALRRLLADARDRVVRVMKGDQLVSIGTLISQDKTANWFVLARPYDGATAVITADGRTLNMHDTKTDLLTGLSFINTDISGGRPYEEVSAPDTGARPLAVGGTIVWLAPQDSFGAPFVEAQTIRGLYGGADQQGYFSLAHASRRLDTTSPAPLPGVPAVDLNGHLIGIADSRGLLLPLNAIQGALLNVQKTIAAGSLLDILAKTTLRYYPVTSADTGDFSFKLVKKDGSTMPVTAAMLGGLKPMVGDDLMELIVAAQNNQPASISFSALNTFLQTQLESPAKSKTKK